MYIDTISINDIYIYTMEMFPRFNLKKRKCMARKFVERERFAKKTKKTEERASKGEEKKRLHSSLPFLSSPSLLSTSPISHLQPFRPRPYFP
jgi:hypothetical protein